MKNYYKLVLKGGHNTKGNRKHFETVRYIKAKDIEEVLEVAKRIRGVKKEFPILECIPISYQDYKEGLKEARKEYFRYCKINMPKEWYYINEREESLKFVSN